MNRLGEVVATYNTYDADYELHHDFLLDSNGNIIALATSLTAKKEDKYVEDRIIKISTATGQVSELVNFKDLLPDLYQKATGLDQSTNNKATTM
ncbi:aryl-sulfate sulfotransferase [Amylolactobacillus amylophilus]|uniref:aryl-sulfate sulfotransferase n=1 Tax=Amylolactobacillus amylophilus TaxID=1603 RepID=UPI000A5E7BAA|nr:aryl-sulfate sulfotransferase [Amylolactobacillus amylophilus]